MLEYSYAQKLLILLANSSKMLLDPFLGPRLRMQGVI